MDTTQSLLLLLVLPLAVWAGGLVVLRGAYQEIQRDWLARGQSPPFSRIILASVYGAVPVLFGLSLWFLSLSFTDALNASASPAVPDAQRLLLWAMLASAVAGCCTIAGQTLILRGRLSGFLGSDFGRVLPISVIPFTDSVFALFLAFLAFDYVDRIAYGAAPASAGNIDASVSALQAYAMASLAIPVAAAVSNRVRDLSSRGFMRALAVAEAGELPIIVGLVLGFLALTGLR